MKRTPSPPTAPKADNNGKKPRFDGATLLADDLADLVNESGMAGGGVHLFAEDSLASCDGDRVVGDEEWKAKGGGMPTAYANIAIRSSSMATDCVHPPVTNELDSSSPFKICPTDLVKNKVDDWCSGTMAGAPSKFATRPTSVEGPEDDDGIARGGNTMTASGQSRKKNVHDWDDDRCVTPQRRTEPPTDRKKDEEFPLSPDIKQSQATHDESQVSGSSPDINVIFSTPVSAEKYEEMERKWRKSESGRKSMTTRYETSKRNHIIAHASYKKCKERVDKLSAENKSLRKSLADTIASAAEKSACLDETQKQLKDALQDKHELVKRENLIFLFHAIIRKFFREALREAIITRDQLRASFRNNVRSILDRLNRKSGMKERPLYVADLMEAALDFPRLKNVHGYRGLEKVHNSGIIPVLKEPGNKVAHPQDARYDQEARAEALQAFRNAFMNRPDFTLDEKNELEALIADSEKYKLLSSGTG